MTRAQAVEAALVEARKRLLLTGRDRDTLDMIDRALALAQVAVEAVASLPTRGDVGRPESTRDPVFLLRWRPKKVRPNRDRWSVEGVWFTREEAEQFATAHAYRWGSDSHGPCWGVYCVPADGELARLLKTVTKRDAPVEPTR